MSPVGPGNEDLPTYMDLITGVNVDATTGEYSALFALFQMCLYSLVFLLSFFSYLTTYKLLRLSNVFLNTYTKYVLTLSHFCLL